MREKPKDNTRLRHMLEAINNVIQSPTAVPFEAYPRQQILRFEVLKNLEIIGEAAYLITKEFREEHQEIAWNEVIGMRHVLVHGYYQIRDEIVWGTIQTDLFPLKDKIERLICK